jgi:hypothetical protein
MEQLIGKISTRNFSVLQNKQNIKRLREDMDWCSRVKNNISQHKIHISSQPSNILYIL